MTKLKFGFDKFTARKFTVVLSATVRPKAIIELCSFYLLKTFCLAVEEFYLMLTKIDFGESYNKNWSITDVRSSYFIQSVTKIEDTVVGYVIVE